MITCYLRYELDPDKLADFEAYGAMCQSRGAAGAVKRSSVPHAPSGEAGKQK